MGSLNKIPISIAGLVLFKVPLSLSNLFSILFGNKINALWIMTHSFKHINYFIISNLEHALPGLFAGIFFARAKMS